MKKTFTLLCLIFFFGCVGESGANSRTSSGPEYPPEVVVRGDFNKEYVMKIYEYTYKGHHYQFHYHQAGNNSVGGPLHDPDCPCHERR